MQRAAAERHGIAVAPGHQPAHVAYWDVVAALTTIGDMGDCMPPLAEHGRSDLDARILTARRAAFLSAALEQFRRS